VQALVRPFDEKGIDCSRNARSFTRKAGKGEAIVKTSLLVALKLAGRGGSGLSMFVEDRGLRASKCLFKNNE
jgi:hypothetical protein